MSLYPIVDLRQKHLPVPTLKESQWRLWLAVHRCNLHKDFAEELALDMIKKRRKK